ncbi:uncharacterized protein [Sagmatias obliquidens]|uniref:uncharacterized protein n=1 Tax=Sagmatias obliquidens TaxID=3371155 RepID=UPI000F443D87|nr:uncharacterized protein LOC113611699 [Lagenorhynchus obliquidens]
MQGTGRGGEVAGVDLHPTSSAPRSPALTWCTLPRSPVAGTFLLSGPGPAMRPGARRRATQASSSPRGGDAVWAVTMETAEAAPASEAAGRPAPRGGQSQLLRGGGHASSLGRAWKGRDSAGRELSNSSSADHGAAGPRLPLSVFRCEVGSAPGPGPSRRASARLRDREAGELHGDQGQEQLPQITFQVTFSQMTFPALHLKEHTKRPWGEFLEELKSGLCRSAGS